MTLYEECIIALKENVNIKSDDESSSIVNKTIRKIPITKYNHIDWERIEVKKSIYALGSIESFLKINKDFSYNDKVFVFWDNANCNVLGTTVANIFKNLDDVLAVGFNTWIVNFEKDYFIEFNHEGEIRMGKIKFE